MEKYESLKDHVYSYITQKIQNGMLLPGQKINEAEICNELGISRTPAREALIQLSSESLIEYIPRKGFLVKIIDTKRKLDVYRIIGTLDALAASLALEYMTPDDNNKMDETLEKIDIAIKYQNYEEYSKLQGEFHDIYISKCDNQPLIELLYSLKHSFIRLTYLSEDKQKLFGVLQSVNQEHKDVAQAFAVKDLDKIMFILGQKHWETTHEDMI
ncbi:MAG: GntR family transcriptional regulator [Acetanaerobacterium sp.]